MATPPRNAMPSAYDVFRESRDDPSTARIFQDMQRSVPVLDVLTDYPPKPSVRFTQITVTVHPASYCETVWALAEDGTLWRGYDELDRVRWQRVAGPEADHG